MRELLLISALSILTSSFLLGQDPPRVSTNYVNVFQQGFVLESLSGYGFLNTTYSPIFNIGVGNPAFMANFTQFSAGFSHQANTKIDAIGFANATLQRINNFLPQSAGIVYSFRDFQIGAGYSQKYSAEIRLEDIPITTAQNPDGTGEFYTANFESTIHSISTIGAYQFNNLISQTDQFSIGIQLNINLLRNTETITTTLAELKEEAVNWKFGFGYTYHHQSIEKLQLGIAYESDINFFGYYKYDRELITEIGPGQFVELIPPPVELTYPSNLKFGFFFEPTPTVGIYSDLTYNFWEEMYPNVPNKLDIAGGIILDASDLLSVSLGYYVLDSYRVDVFGGREDAESDAVYISGGVVLRFRHLDFHLVLADSHLFSGERSKQTIGKVGIGFNL